MNCYRETAKMGVPPGNNPAVSRDWFPYLNGTSQGPTLEDARKDGHIIRARSAQSRKWAPSFVFAVTPGREFM
jgi:hypothetical protein